MFHRTQSAFGISDPSVETWLDSPHAVPGRPMTGQVYLQAGASAAEVSRITLSLVAEVEGEHGPGSTAEFFRLVLHRDIQLSAGQLLILPFQLPVPWETPITAVGGAPLPRTAVGLRTELVVAGGAERDGLDWVQVNPMPVQNTVLEAFTQLGFSFREVGVATGRVPDLPQEMGFHQSFAFASPAPFADRVDEVELVFVAGEHELCVLLAADRRGGPFPDEGSAFGHFRMSHADAQACDWTAVISGWLALTAERDRVNHDHA
ncbi:sporulation protein [Crossiella cryophila]|uniref:Sporulation-control protein n=1 Tax=Crossiella cryophila TaxID=43355 RepID=A0A7W7CCA5_9PSEU|nr:sporulation protein [Crossiella cryophila]MBB4678550.1 sporulation-control protein [Crossiella cryophila]